MGSEPLFKTIDVSRVPWWFGLISWAIPSVYSVDGNSETWIEAKCFKGKIYIVAIHERRL